jgi:DNA-binding transcriptional MerR regulator
MSEIQFVNVKKAAALLGVCKITLRRWDEAGQFKPDIRTAGGHRRYSIARLKELAGAKNA